MAAKKCALSTAPHTLPSHSSCQFWWSSRRSLSSPSALIQPGRLSSLEACLRAPPSSGMLRNTIVDLSETDHGSMHYVGEAGISNYSTSFSAPTVAGSCLIAVFAATAALGLFFRLKSHWSSAAWRRLLCAALLALAISSMHWVAVIGTTYRAKPDKASLGGVSSKTAGWICGILVGDCGLSFSNLANALLRSHSYVVSY